jgi:hypothetical protein
LSAYIIQPDPRCPVYGPHVGWRKWVHRFLRIPFKKPRVVLQDGQRLICNPDTLRWITTFLDGQGVQYRVLPPLLKRIK